MWVIPDITMYSNRTWLKGTNGPTLASVAERAPLRCSTHTRTALEARYAGTPVLIALAG